MGNEVDHIDVLGIGMPVMHIARLSGLRSNENDFFTHTTVGFLGGTLMLPVIRWKLAKTLDFHFTIIVTEGENVVVEKIKLPPLPLTLELAHYQTMDPAWTDKPEVRKRLLVKMNRRVSDFIEDARNEAEEVRKRYLRFIRKARPARHDQNGEPMANDNDTDGRRRPFTLTVV